MNKKLLISTLMSMLVASALLFPQQSGIAAAAAENSQAPMKTKIILDGYPLEFSAEPVVVQGSTMVPFRGIAEALNIEVLWNAKSQTVTANQATADGEKAVVLQLNQKTAKVSGQEVELAAAPFSRAGTTYIPLSFFSKQFGAQVSWDQKSRVVALQSPPKKMYSLAFYALKSFGERQYIPQFDSVAFGWARLQDDGTITTSGSEYNWPQAAGDITPERILDKAKQDGTSPYLMVYATDGKNELAKMLEDSALRDKAIEDIMKLAADKGFSGIVLDFEGLGLSGDIKKAKRDYNEFVTRLSKQAKAANIKLSLALHPLNGAYKGYDYKTLSTVADDLIIMAYEYTKGKNPEPLGKVNEAIKLALKEVPKEKLVLGISTWSENEHTISSVIGLAKRYQLKGTAMWRLGLIGEASKAQIDKQVIPLKS